MTHRFKSPFSNQTRPHKFCRFVTTTFANETKKCSVGKRPSLVSVVCQPIMSVKSIMLQELQNLNDEEEKQKQKQNIFFLHHEIRHYDIHQNDTQHSDK
jgi:hypothetical protein